MSEVTSVWYRKPVFKRTIFDNPEMNSYVEIEVEAALEGVLRCLPANFVSHPKAIYHAEYKLVQLQEALRCGFQVPDTLLTSDYSQGKEFLDTYVRSITKPLRRGRLIKDSTVTLFYTTELSQNQLERHQDSLKVTPAYIQKRIDKQYDLRVTVFGHTVFCVAIHSQEQEDTKLDWRRKQEDLKETVFDLPQHIVDKCINLVKSLDLQYGAIDLILDTEGNYYFLEINPTGQWAWMEQELDLPMREALYRTLEGSYAK
ncbi:hypothetical protein GI364_17765 [Alicyclobacillus sp. SO9]|nr:hypothetical protein [Alicyclobacillus sp. SO9]QQE77761.1 hypothetical protein GI364_17765 [Alicyclobacillus sp. SO9]